MKGVQRLLPPLFAAILRVWGRTWRIRVEGLEFSPRGSALPPHVYAAWHHSLLLHGYLERDQGVCVGVSEHADGELGARAAEHLGYITARGSSTHGAMRLIRELLTKARHENLHLALTPDGPRGPSGRSKPGVLYLAAALGCPVVPLGAWASPHLRLKSWDRFMVPSPFARVGEVFGEPLHVEPHPDDARMEELCAELDRRIDRCEERARALVE